MSLRFATLLACVPLVAVACSDLRGAEEDTDPSRFPDGAARPPGAFDGGEPDGEAKGEPNATRDLEVAMWPLPPPYPKGADYGLTSGTVRDERTHLVWERAPRAGSMTLAEARAHCEGLTAEGDDWRVPTRIELLSIVDYATRDPALSREAFDGASQAGTYWTSSPDALAASTRAWTVGASLGIPKTEPITGAFRVRCVRALPEPSAGWVDVTADTATDRRTGLSWQRRALPKTMGFVDAVAACQASKIAGLGWRVPNARELESLTDVRAASAPAWDRSIFGTDDGGPTWSSTAENGDTSRALVIDFTPERTVRSLGETELARVRCVAGS